MKILTILLFLMLPLTGLTVFIATDSPNINTTPPPDDQGWSSMAVYNHAGAVYLGQGWFITAGHLGTGAATVSFDSAVHNINSSSWTSITNANGTFADIRLFQVSNPGNISAQGTTVNSSALSISAPLTMIGYGRDVSSVDTQGQTVKYYQGSSSQMKWGYNEISGIFSGVSADGYTSDAFETTLGAGKAQALDKDSGGGVFIYDEDSEEYLLAGILFVTANMDSDENGVYALTSPQKNSKTYAVNLSVYESQIAQVIPEPSTVLLMAGLGAVFYALRRYRRMAF